MASISRLTAGRLSRSRGGCLNLANVSVSQSAREVATELPYLRSAPVSSKDVVAATPADVILKVARAGDDEDTPRLVVTMMGRASTAEGMAPAREAWLLEVCTPRDAAIRPALLANSRVRGSMGYMVSLEESAQWRSHQVS